MKKNSNHKRVILNIITNLSYELIIIVFGLVLPRLYLVNFGSDVNGLDSTIKNIFAYLALLEAGVGLSAQYALYGPVAEDRKSDINGILSATRAFYFKSGVIYTAITVVFALVYPLIVKSELDYFTISAVIFLYGIPGIILFLFRGKYTAFLEVKGKQYILTTLSTVTLIVSNLLRLVFLLISDNLILIQATYCLPSIIQIVFVAIYVKRRYAWVDWHAKPDYGALSQKKSVLVHQISGVIFANTDTVIISIMSGMNFASVYAVFTLFFHNIQKLMTSFTKSITFKFGQLYQLDKDKFEHDFSVYESVYYLGLFSIFTVVTAFLMPIIRLYTSGLKDSAIYDSTLILLLFSVTNIMTAIEQPQIQLINIAGKFTDTRHQAIIEMTLNIVVSVLTTLKFGLIGCLMGTIAALGYRINAVILFAAKHIRTTPCLQSYKKIAVNVIVYVAVLLLIGTESCPATGYVSVVLHAALHACWIVPLFIAANFVTDYKNYIAAIKQLLSKLKHKQIAQ